MGKLIPILLALIGLGAGVGAGLALRPEAADPQAAGEACPCTCAEQDLPAATANAPVSPSTGTDFVRLNNQFVVPVVRSDQISALVVLSLSLEVPTGGSEPIYQREPKLRDRFLQVLFDHANAGGFDGAFTAGSNMELLRTALREVARAELGPSVQDVLITDIARQDI